MKANEKQVAGNHYRSKIQHWDLVRTTGMGYFEGQITKYVSRWRKKNGVQDLEKALHFLQKYLEVIGVGYEYRQYPHDRELVKLVLIGYSELNGLTEEEAEIIRLVVLWSSRYDLLEAESKLKKLIASSTGTAPQSEPGEVPLSGDECVCRHPQHAHGPDDGPCSWEGCVCHGFTPEDGSAPGPGYVCQDPDVPIPRGTRGRR